MILVEQILLAVVSTVLLMVAALSRPSAARCASGYVLIEGVRIAGPEVGSYVCEKAPPPNCGEAAGPFEGVPCPTAARYRSRIYCTGGAIPIVVDEKTVGCQRVFR